MTSNINVIADKGLLKGSRKSLWAITISGNWRMVFEFRDGHAYVVNYEDYH